MSIVSHKEHQKSQQQPTKAARTQLSDRHYLLKVNQVPVQEFLKLRFNYDKRKEQEMLSEQNKILSVKRYKELTAQYTCNNRDPRLIIKEEPKIADATEAGQRSQKGSQLNRIQTNQGSLTIRVNPNQDVAATMMDKAAIDKAAQFKTEFSKYIHQGEFYEPKRKNVRRQQIQFQEEVHTPLIISDQAAKKRLEFVKIDNKTFNEKHSKPFGKPPLEELNSDLKVQPISEKEGSLAKPKKQMQLSYQFFKKRTSNSHNHKSCYSPEEHQPGDKTKILQRNSVASEFMQTGMGMQFQQLLNYNSLKYSQNSPRGLEIRLLSAQPDLAKLKHSQFKSRKHSQHQSCLQTPFTELLSNQQDPDSKHQPRDELMYKSLFQQSENFMTPKPLSKQFSPIKNQKGDYHIFRDIDYDTWFSSKVRQMKNVSQLKYQCKDEKNKNYSEIKNFCNTKSKFNFMSKPNSPRQQ